MDKKVYETIQSIDLSNNSRIKWYDYEDLEESLTDEEREELALDAYEEALSEGDRWG